MEAKSGAGAGAEAGAGAMAPKEVDPGAFWSTSLKQRNHCFPVSFRQFRCKFDTNQNYNPTDVESKTVKTDWVFMHFLEIDVA